MVEELKTKMMKPPKPHQMFPLTSPQSEIWFDQMLHSEPYLYNIGGYVQIDGSIDPALFESAINLLVKRHDTLRTLIVQGTNQVPMQTFLENFTVTVPFHDFSGENHSHESALAWIQKQFVKPFDLYEKQLFQFALLKINDNCYYWLKKYHHLIIDGLGISLICQSLSEIYSKLSKGQKVEDVELSYLEFVKYDRKYIESDRYKVDRQYWTGKYQTLPEPLFTPRYLSQFPNQTTPSDCKVLSLKRPFYNRLILLAKNCKVSTFHLILGALYVYFIRTSQADELVVGLPVLNRPNASFKKTVGLFVGASATRLSFGTDLSFNSLLNCIGRELKQYYRYQRFPISELNREIGLRQVGRKQLPDINVSYEKHNYDTPFNSYLTHAKVILHGYEQKPLRICVREYHDNEDVDIDFEYNLAYFNSLDIECIQSHFMLILEHVLNHDEVPIRSIPLLSETEHQQLIDWNQTETNYPKDKTIVDLFQEQVEKTPNNIAVVFEGQQLTYRELNQKANQVAHYLCNIKTDTTRDGKPNDNCPMTNDKNLIGICVERSLEMVIGLLGILKAGAAYVPIDPSYPSQRLQFMLKDSEVELLLSQSHLQDLIPATPKVICLDSGWEQFTNCSRENPLRQSGPENLAYVIYTSGSTGAPKGAMNTHQGICNRLLWMQDAYQLTADDNVLQKTPFSFDVSVWEFFWPLLVGARLTVAKPGGHKDGDYLTRLIEQEKITTLHFVPSMLQVFLQGSTIKNGHFLKRVICSGEALSVEIQKRFFACLPDVDLHNLYGPTEAAVDVTYWQCQSENQLNFVPIGRPIANTQIHIIDSSLNLTPLGIPGELCISGVGLASGYLNRPDLTAEKFIEIKLYGREQLVYKTGDLARWSSDGNLEYLGRLDNQVKLRGFRIELGEIETFLSWHQLVKEAVVTVYETDDTKRLAAYITVNSHQSLRKDENSSNSSLITELRSWLKTRLPEYMIPSGFTILEQMPLTPNGKIDRKALPAPDAERTGFSAPQTFAEQLIANIWQELLGIDRIGIYDDFFDIGGNSLDGMRFINKLKEKTGEVFHIYVLFEATTIAKFVDYLKIHYPKLMSKMDDSYSLSEIYGQDSLEKVTAEKLEQFRQLLPESNFKSTNNGDKNPLAIFIFAPPRSGTTLLRVILGGHPRLFAPPEIELLGFNTLKERYTRCMERDSFWLEGAIRALMEIKNCEVEEARELITAYEEKDLNIKEFYKVLQTDIGDRVLVDKTPFYALDVNILKQAEKHFDNAVYIHLLRHPYGMIHSFEKTRLEQIISSHPYAFPLKDLAKPGSSKELAELFWLQCHQNILEFLQTIPASRQYALKFEELVDHPQPVIKSLCKFLELPFHPNMLQPYQEKKQRMTDGLNAVGNMLGDIKFHTHQQIDAKVAKGWKKTYKEDFLNDMTWDIAERLGYKRELGEINIPRVPEGKPLSLSFPQQRLWFLAQLDQQSATYNMPAALRFTGCLNETALKRAFIALVERHDSLRLCFPAVDGEPTAQLNEIYDPLKVTDLSSLSKSEQQHQTDTWIKNHTQTAFDLNTGPLLSTRLLKLNEQEHILLFNMHHIIGDGWSIGVLIREWSLLYNAYVENREHKLPELKIRYTDYAAWQRDWLQGEVLDEQFNYWKDKLGGVPELLKLPTDYPRPAEMSFRGKHIKSVLDQELTQGLNRLSRQQGATLFMTLLAAFNVLLSRYSGQSDLAVGSSIANRTHRQTEDLIGFFVNTLVLRTQVKGKQTFLELLKQVKETALEAYSYQDIPFEYLVEQLNPSRSMSHTPVFQVMFILQNAPKEKLELSGLTMSFMEPQHTTAKFDLTLSITEQDDLFICDWEYNTDLFHPDTITRMSKHFHVLLDGILANPEQSLSQLPLITKTEQQQLMAWNQTETDYPKDKTIIDLFHEQVETTPDNIAVVFEEQELTYRQLNQKANQVAHYLCNIRINTTRDCKPNDNCPMTNDNNLIGIFIERSMEMVISLLGILKAGAAYVPLDPNYPQQRLQFMLEDSKVPVLLTQEHLIDRLPKYQAKVVSLDSDWKHIEEYSTGNPTNYNASANSAYVIYTSGSIGQPKGVIGTHQGMVNRLNWMWKAYHFEDKEVCCHRSSINFVDHIAELFSPLLKGVSLVLLTKEEMRDTAAIINILHQYKITRILLVPSLLKSILEQGDHELKKLGFVKYWFCSGEHFPSDLVKLFYERLSGRCLLNIYGSSEVSADVMAYQVKSEDIHTVSIGKPISNTQVYILDESLEIVPIGVFGELHIGGAGLAHGYLNRPELTTKNFIEFTVNGKAQRLYKTGDLARWLPTGNIEYLGRIDHQVKLRGFRIEPGEIEVALKKHHNIQEAAVIIQEAHEDKRLLAYFVPQLPNQSIHSPVTVDNESQAKQVEQWQQIWNDTYGQSNPTEIDSKFNTIGWDSSYTKRPFSKDEMKEWLNGTVDQILLNSPSRILEIGCGTGMLIFQIAPHCDHYTGTDISSEALQQVEQNKKRWEFDSKVKLIQSSADNLDSIKDGSYNAVILNSVVQYFPSIDYLVTVLTGAVQVVAPGGFIFIGDIRNLKLLEDFHASVQLYHAKDSLNTVELQQRVQKSISKEKELLIDPEFFFALKSRLPQVSQVQIQLKPGYAHNEMTHFRYDVKLYICAESTPDPQFQWLDWQKDHFTLERVRQLLVEEQPDILGLKRIPNARLLSEMKIVEQLAHHDGTVKEFRELITTPDNGVEPEEFRVLTDSLPYRSYINYFDKYNFTTVFQRQNLHGILPLFNEAGSSTERAWHTYANNPYQDTTVGHKLVSELRDFLKQTLPEYMIPSAFVPLESMPLTPNGKADRKALSQLSFTRVKSKGDIVPPQTPEEELLVTIWTEVLGIEEISIFDNFFDSGGHSLLATRLVSRICESFEIEMPLRSIFELPTVHGLAQSIVMYRQTGTFLSTNDSKIDFCAEKSLEPSIQAVTPVRHETITDPKLILLTGATGFLGAHLLYELLEQTNADINCLVRTSHEEGINRICKTLKSYSLWNESFSARIIPIVGDLAKPLFGISKTEFNELANSIDVIYHNGAWVNHIYPYQILKAANVSGTLEILKLATQTVSKPVHYISSLSCLSPIDPDKDRALLNNIVTKVNHGYLQSKWVAEQLVQQAGERGIPISIFRPQRIIGHSKTGISNQNDFFSLLMKGCIQLKMMPNLNCIEGNLIPVDYTVNAIVHLSRQISSLQQTYEITNSQNTNWNTLFNKLRSKGYKLEQTPYEIWREKLSSQPKNALFPLLPLFPKEIPEDSKVKNEQKKQQLFNLKTDERLAAANIVCPTINDSLLENYFSYFTANNFFDAP